MLHENRWSLRSASVRVPSQENVRCRHEWHSFLVQVVSSMIDSTTFMTWLKHFSSIVGCSKDEPHILLLDGNESHKTLEAIDLAREHGIIIQPFPPHGTHRLQPLDRTYFKSLKSAYGQGTRNHAIRTSTQFYCQCTVYSEWIVAN